MSQVDLVIRGGKVVSPDHIIEASVAIDNGIIVAVGHDDLMPSAREEIRADGLYLLPGAIDSHVHFRDPGYPNKETWKTGSAAAACGGVTTVFEMPNTNPATGTVEALRLKQKAAESSYVDFGIHGLFGDDTVDRLEELLDAGVTSFKAFVGNTFGNLPAPTDGCLLEGFENWRRSVFVPSCMPRIRPSWRGARPSCRPPAAMILSRIWPRVRPWPRSKPLAVWSRWPNGPAPACTSRITARPIRSICCAKPNAAAWTSRPRPARNTC
ncbi:amidohydrolase family protein [Pigmentiphaga litoralis]|uniref:amidohydrolase family protein n=1 Tax=Pigmentiphaga litoralis TaxID=516702 RepID=UPI003B42C554